MRMLGMLSMSQKEVVIVMSVAELKSMINVMGQSDEGFEEYEQLSDILDRFQRLRKTIHLKEADTDA